MPTLWTQGFRPPAGHSWEGESQSKALPLQDTQSGALRRVEMKCPRLKGITWKLAARPRRTGVQSAGGAREEARLAATAGAEGQRSPWRPGLWADRAAPGTAQ